MNHVFEKGEFVFVVLQGSKCQNPNCGIELTDSNLCIFDFHHLNPEEKETVYEWKKRGFEQKILEGKIRLFCSNCHRLEHQKKK